MRIFYFFISTLIISNNAFSMNFSISPVINDLVADKKVMTTYYTLSSNSSENIYLKIYAKKIVNAKLDNEEEISPDGLSSLILTPEKLILRPYEVKKVRSFIKTDPYSSEEIYRIYFEQVSDFESFDNHPETAATGVLPLKLQLSSVLKVIPKFSKAVVSNRNGRIFNSGNRHLRITEKCMKQEENDCRWEPIKTHLNLYPNNEIDWETSELKGSTLVKYILPPDDTKFIHPR